MPAREARVRAHAKINLSLKVLHKRPDGFHEIRSVFQTIALADTLEIGFAAARRTSVTIEGMPGVPVEDNLITKAARAVLGAGKCQGHVSVRVRKRIPMGGGLGGGSSNAAAMLLTLPALAGFHLPLPALMEVGARLGSDVPFFVTGGTALGLGRGEELYPLPELAAPYVLLVTPPVHVSTPEAYRALARELTALPELAKLKRLQSFVWSGLLDGLENDFEPAVFKRHPVLGRIRKQLVALGAPEARMSGSGAALFGVFPDRVDLERALTRFRSEQLPAHPTRFISRARYQAAWKRSLALHVEGDQWPPRSKYENR